MNTEILNIFRNLFKMFTQKSKTKSNDEKKVKLVKDANCLDSKR